MFETIKNAWKVIDLRKKIIFTLFIILIFRIGAIIPIPFLDKAALAALMGDTTGGTTNLLSYLNEMSGGAFSQATLFAMSIIPYINASIILNLLTVAIPALERLAKEGESGRKKIAAITRYVTVGFGLVQGTAYYLFLRNSTATLADGTTANIVADPFRDGASGWFVGIIIVLAFTAGSALVMWLGEQINQYGVGNGISVILFSGIIARLPATITTLVAYLQMGSEAPQYYFFVPLVVAVLAVLIWVIVFMHDAERRLPVQYAKRIVGRKQYGGQSSHMPIKVSMSGVMPIIFASSLLSLPSTIVLFTGKPEAGSFWGKTLEAISTGGWLYSVVYFFLIIAFAYFYTAVQYNPVEMSNNLRKNNGTIPGIRPGKPTADYISRVLSKITLIGALFLALIALLPIIVSGITGVNVSLGGTSIIIMVGVALETSRQIESQMMMRHYKGFLE